MAIARHRGESRRTGRITIPVFRPAVDGIEPYLKLNKAARLDGVSLKTLRFVVESGRDPGLPIPCRTARLEQLAMEG